MDDAQKYLEEALQVGARSVPGCVKSGELY